MLARIGAAAALFAVLGLPVTAFAQGAESVKEARPGLLARTKITPDSARAVALRAGPGSVIQEAEVEEEHGRLVYSFDLRRQGKSGIEEVQVDARTGKVVCTEHESEADERSEYKEQGKDSTHMKGRGAEACGS